VFAVTECLRCGTTEELDCFGNTYICADCTPIGNDFTKSERFDTTGEHENPVDVSDVTDAERAGMLSEYLERFVDEFGNVPRLMPLDDEGKAPIIEGRAKLDSSGGRSFLVDGQEVIRQIREKDARGFAIYAGKADHGTEDAVFIDHDDDRFPTPTADPTFEVLSGSGRGNHETYRNAGDVQNARVDDDVGEIRAENWYVVAPGSVHPTGGVYHLVENRDIATLADKDLDDSMRPASVVTIGTTTAVRRPSISRMRVRLQTTTPSRSVFSARSRTVTAAIASGRSITAGIGLPASTTGRAQNSGLRIAWIRGSVGVTARSLSG
jgi:hypothetical protein